MAEQRNKISFSDKLKIAKSEVLCVMEVAAVMIKNNRPVDNDDFNRLLTAYRRLSHLGREI